MITLEQAKRNSDQLTAAANKVLEKYKILELLAKYGQVIPEGSYSYGMMVYPDVDIMVVNPGIKPEQIAELGTALLLTDGINRSEMKDFTKNERREGLPYGYYVSTKILAEDLDLEWKFDIWLVPALPDTEKRSQGMEKHDWMSQRSSEEKDAMLLLKAQLWEMGIYIHKGVGSFHVYRAVMNGIRDVDKFFIWMKSEYGYDPRKL